MSSLAPKPLIVPTADKDAKLAIEELIRRHQQLGIRPIEADVVAHPGHDAGTFRKGHEFLRSFLNWERALVIFDHEGCGRENQPREAIEAIIEANLTSNGWQDRSRAVVISPELEAWLWDQTYQVNRLLAWRTGAENCVDGCMRDHLRNPGMPNRSARRKLFRPHWLSAVFSAPRRCIGNSIKP